MATDTTYLTDLSDAEWEVVLPLLPCPTSLRGRPRRHTLRTILNAIFYILRSGCAWRLLPNDLPAWQPVYHYVRAWRLDGTWMRVHTFLRERLRVGLGRDPQPSAGIIDSQSVKTTGVGGVRGYDGGKQVKGRKRHLLVDTEGLVLTVSVHPADIMDRDGVKLLLREPVPAQFPRLRHVWVDAAYNGKVKGKDWIERTLGWIAQIVAHPPRYKKVGFRVISHSTRLTGPSISRRPASACCHGGGSSSGRLLGRARIGGGSARTTSGCARPAKPSSTWR